MRRDGRTSYEQEQGGSSFLSGLGWLVGGLGVGAGLLYFLDPDKGSKRRGQIVKQAKNLASTASEYAGSAYESAKDYVGSALGRGSKTASEKFSDVQDWSKDRLEALGDYIHERLGGQTRTQRIVGVSICALSSMALGAALMYIFDPAMGPQRRSWAKQTFQDYSSRAGEAIRSGAQQVGQSVSNVAGQVAHATGLSHQEEMQHQG